MRHLGTEVSSVLIKFDLRSGMFGEDIGEDYFGYKDLGLDKEYDCGHSREVFTANVNHAPIWMCKYSEETLVWQEQRQGFG